MQSHILQNQIDKSIKTSIKILPSIYNEDTVTEL